jgi:hypothetical protein
MAFLDSATEFTTNATPQFEVPNAVGAVPLLTNDVVLGFVTWDSTAPTVETGDPPVNFTEFAGSEVELTHDNQQGVAMWKRCTADNETGVYAFQGATGSSTTYLSMALSVRGRHLTNPPVCVVTSSSPASSGSSSPVSFSAGPLDLLDGDDVAVVVLSDKTTSNGITGYTAPTGFDDFDQFQSGFFDVAIFTKENASAGNTGALTGSFTLSGGTSGYIAYAIRIPAAGVAAAIDATTDALVIAEQGATVRQSRIIAATVDALAITEHQAAAGLGLALSAGADELVIAEQAATIGLQPRGYNIGKMFRYPSPLLRM